MEPLDAVLGGGFRSGDLAVLTGRPGVGKTITALQWARECALRDREAIYVCYEHSPQDLLGRLFSLEIASGIRDDRVHSVDRLVERAQAAMLGVCALEEVLADPLAADAYAYLQTYARRLLLVPASGRTTDAEAIDRVIDGYEDQPVALFIDYVQKMPTPRALANDDERSTHLAEALKELAIRRNVAVVAIAAADRAAFAERRIGMRHMRGSSALAYEADVVVAVNEKESVVSKAHLAYDSVRADQFRRMLVFSIEKHRNGPSGLDMEFAKDFAHFRVATQGSFVAERLVDGILCAE
jgi:replicative DNA helicase